MSEDGKPITCKEKISLLNNNLDEIELAAQDFYDDAIIMGANEKQFKTLMVEAISSLSSKYLKK